MKFKVSIEVGHGGTDPGAVGGNLQEKNVALVMSLECRRQLQRHDCEVLISRTTDVNDPAAAFFTRAAQWKPDVGISVHLNAAANVTATGFEAFHQTASSQRAGSVSLCQIIADEVSTVGQVLRNPPVRNAITHPTQNGERFTTLMNSVNAPYAYTELAFLTNAADRSRIDTPEKQRAFGTAYAKAIIKFLGLTWIDETPPQNTYTVISGDNFAGIARKLNVTLEALLAANSQIPAVGQRLNVPVPAFVPYRVQVIAAELRIRSAPSTANSVVIRTARAGELFTIVEESNGVGANRWGRIQNTSTWLALDFTVKI